MNANAVAVVLTAFVISAVVYPGALLYALFSAVGVAAFVLVGWLLLKIFRRGRRKPRVAVWKSACDAMGAPVCPKALPDGEGVAGSQPAEVRRTMRNERNDFVPFVPAALCPKSERRGMAGEMRVGAHLRTLPRGYIVLNDFMMPAGDGATTQIDHIVVSEFGIFVLETKNYSGWIFGDAKRREWVQTLPRGRHRAKKSRFQNPIHQNWRHICALADNLGISRDYFKSVVVFTEGCEFKSVMPPNVVFASRVVEYIASFTTKVIKERQLGEIATAIGEWEAVLPDDARATHVANLRNLHPRGSASTPRPDSRS